MRRQCGRCNNYYTDRCDCDKHEDHNTLSCPPLANLSLAEQVVQIIRDNDLLQNLANAINVTIPTVPVLNNLPDIPVLLNGSIVLGVDNNFYKVINNQWVRFGMIYPPNAVLLYTTTETMLSVIETLFPLNSIVININTGQIFFVV